MIKVQKLILSLILVFSIIGSSNQIVATSVSPLIPPISVNVSATADSVNQSIWMLPGPRSLDPSIFGTPANPLKTNWLPVSMRNKTTDGSAFTTTSDVTPFSNKTKQITGSLILNVTDKTKYDTPVSEDTANVRANFTDPSGKTNYFVQLQKLIPVGPDHPFFGGVGINTYMHGATEIGTPLMPGAISFVTLWGFGDFYVNGSLVDTHRLIHVMVSERVRTNDFKLGFGVQDHKSLEIHFIMPNTKVNSSGPFTSPLPTKFILPNGVEQPFIHVNFYNLIVSRSEPTKTITTTQSTTSSVTTTVQKTITQTTPGFSYLIGFISVIIVVFLYKKIRKVSL